MRELIAEARALMEDYKGKGVMIALWPNPTTAARLAEMGNEPSEDLHLTLAYLGTTDELTPFQIARARQVVSEMARKWKPLPAKIAGVGRFSASKTSDGKDVIWASPDVPDLPEMRHELVQRLEAAGLMVKKDHGYTPHITLSYIDSQDKTAINHFEPFDTKFSTIVLAVGGDQARYKLGG